MPLKNVCLTGQLVQLALLWKCAAKGQQKQLNSLMDGKHKIVFSMRFLPLPSSQALRLSGAENGTNCASRIWKDGNGIYSMDQQNKCVFLCHIHFKQSQSGTNVGIVLPAEQLAMETLAD